MQRDHSRVVFPGTVYLVGAGPGDPELLTVKAARLIAEADDIVVDALVRPEVYRGSRARIVYVGKRGGRPSVDQRDIERMLVELGNAGRRVVRLKGGDPCVFGRVAEEIDALDAAGIPWEIVPGVSSAAAAPAAAGIAITERGVADRVTVLTGHRRDGAATSLPNIPPYDPHQTLVVLMGLRRLSDLVASLLACGYPSSLPAAAVSSATLPHERTVACSLGTLVHAVAEAELAAPTALVFGAVARRAAAGGRSSSRGGGGMSHMPRIKITA